MIALTLALLLQDTPAPAPQPSPRNPILEGVAVQAGDELVTLSEFQRALKRMRELEPPPDRDAEARQFRRALIELSTARLEAQEGADLGLDPDQIKKISRNALQAEREKAGLDQYLAQLHSEGKDPMREEADRKEEILQAMWEYKTVGNAFAGRRATRDLQVRPGELRAVYAEYKNDLAPTTVQLRVLMVPSHAAGSPDAARESCEDARTRVLAGEDFALLVEERGVESDSRGLYPFRRPVDFRDPRVRAFAQDAEIGDLSEVTAILSPKTGEPDPAIGYQLIQLHDRNVPPEPEFGMPEIQRQLRSTIAQHRREQVLGRERDRLHRESYSWINPIAAPRPPASPTTPPTRP